MEELLNGTVVTEVIVVPGATAVILEMVEEFVEGVAELVVEVVVLEVV